jgi:hypothetical protein
MPLIISLFLFVISAYLIWWAVFYDVWVWIAPAGVCLITGIGLNLRCKWAAYLWILLAATFLIWWIYLTPIAIIFDWPSYSLLEIVISLIPNGLLVPVCITGSVGIYRKLKNGNYLRGKP